MISRLTPLILKVCVRFPSMEKASRIFLPMQRLQWLIRSVPSRLRAPHPVIPRFFSISCLCCCLQKRTNTPTVTDVLTCAWLETLRSICFSSDKYMTFTNVHHVDSRRDDYLLLLLWLRPRLQSLVCRNTSLSWFLPVASVNIRSWTNWMQLDKDACNSAAA